MSVSRYSSVGSLAGTSVMTEFIPFSFRFQPAQATRLNDGHLKQVHPSPGARGDVKGRRPVTGGAGLTSPEGSGTRLSPAPRLAVAAELPERLRVCDSETMGEIEVVALGVLVRLVLVVGVQANVAEFVGDDEDGVGGRA